MGRGLRIEVFEIGKEVHSLPGVKWFAGQIGHTRQFK